MTKSNQGSQDISFDTLPVMSCAYQCVSQSANRYAAGIICYTLDRRWTGYIHAEIDFCSTRLTSYTCTAADSNSHTAIRVISLSVHVVTIP